MLTILVSHSLAPVVYFFYLASSFCHVFLFPADQNGRVHGDGPGNLNSCFPLCSSCLVSLLRSWRNVDLIPVLVSHSLAPVPCFFPADQNGRVHGDGPHHLNSFFPLCSSCLVSPLRSWRNIGLIVVSHSLAPVLYLFPAHQNGRVYGDGPGNLNFCSPLCSSCHVSLLRTWRKVVLTLGSYSLPPAIFTS